MTIWLARSMTPFSPADEAAGHDFRRGFDFSSELVDGNDRHDKTILAQMTPIFDDQILDHIGPGAGVDADAANIHASRFARAQFVESENVSAFDEHDIADRATHGSGQFGVQLELAIFAVDGNEILGPNKVDDELQLFLAGVPADVYRRVRAIVVDDKCFSPKKMIDHAVNGFFIARNDARGEDDRIAFFYLGVLVVVNCRARKG